MLLQQEYSNDKLLVGMPVIGYSVQLVICVYGYINGVMKTTAICRIMSRLSTILPLSKLISTAD